MFDQVGIVAINLLGGFEGDEDEDEEYDDSSDYDNNHEYHRKPKHRVPQESVSAFDRIVGGNKDAHPKTDLSTELNLDAEVAIKLNKLIAAKNKAVDMEDYILAKQIKNVENELKILGGRIAQIDIAKKEAVIREDYDKAKELKDEMVDLRKEIETMIGEVDISALFPDHEEMKQDHQLPPMTSTRSHAQQYPTGT